MNAGENVEKLSDKTEETSENKPEQTQPTSTETEQPQSATGNTEQPVQSKQKKFFRKRK